MSLKNKGRVGPRTADVLEIVSVDHPAFSMWRDRAGGDHRRVSARGDVNLLARHQFMALFCSVRSSGDVILKTYDLARALRHAGIPVIGGFHSPMEKECLRLLLRGQQPVVVCPARSIEGMRIPADWRCPLAEGRLLLLSPFSSSQRRPTEELAVVRNDLVAALAHRVFITHAAPDGKTEAFARKVLEWGKPLLTLESPANFKLLEMGALALTAENASSWTA